MHESPPAWMMLSAKPFDDARQIGDAIGVDWNEVDIEQFAKGLEVELEHGRRDPQTNVTDDDRRTTGRIALAHLKEDRNYYTKLKKAELSTAPPDWMVAMSAIGMPKAPPLPRVAGTYKQPHINYAHGRDKAVWTKYKGVRGGEGWINQFGEVLYQDKPPGEKHQWGLPEKHLEHSDPEFVKRMSKNQRNMSIYRERVEELDGLVDKLVAASSAGQAKKGWYENSAKSLKAIFGQDANRFVALLAATSPRQAVEKNMDVAAHIYSEWVKAGRPSKADTTKTFTAENKKTGKVRTVVSPWFSFMDKVPGAALYSRVPNTIEALQASDEAINDTSSQVFSDKSFKIESFRRNLMGDLEHSTNDAWMAMFAGIPHNTLGKEAGYKAYTAAVREAADKLGWTPAEVQECTWSFFRELVRLQKFGLSSGQALHHITHEGVANTPDFATLLLEDPHVRRQLEELGFAEAIARFGAQKPGGDVPPLSGRVGQRSKTLRSVSGQASRFKTGIKEKGVSPHAGKTVLDSVTNSASGTLYDPTIDKIKKPSVVAPVHADRASVVKNDPEDVRRWIERNQDKISKRSQRAYGETFVHAAKTDDGRVRLQLVKKAQPGDEGAIDLRSQKTFFSTNPDFEPWGSEPPPPWMMSFVPHMPTLHAGGDEFRSAYSSLPKADVSPGSVKLPPDAEAEHAHAGSLDKIVGDLYKRHGLRGQVSFDSLNQGVATAKPHQDLGAEHLAEFHQAVADHHASASASHTVSGRHGMAATHRQLGNYHKALADTHRGSLKMSSSPPPSWMMSSFDSAKHPRVPKGYTKDHPLVIGGKPHIGGQFVDDQHLDAATPEQRAILGLGPKKDQAHHVRHPLRTPARHDDHGQMRHIRERADRLGHELYHKLRRVDHGHGHEIKLTKDELERLLHHGTAGVMSAGRSAVVEEDKSLTQHDLDRRFHKLLGDVIDNGLRYVRVHGVYDGHHEDSLIIPEASRKEMEEWGRRYNQEAVIFSDRGHNEWLITHGPNAGRKHLGQGFDFVPDADDFYSEIEDPAGKKHKFVMKFDFEKLLSLAGLDGLATIALLSGAEYRGTYDGPVVRHSAKSLIETVLNGSAFA